MKKLLFFSMALVIAHGAQAQIREVILNVAGGFDVVVEPLPGELVRVTNDGYIIDMNQPDFSNLPYYKENNVAIPASLPVAYLARGRKVKRAFEGKVASIGGIAFEYSTKNGAYGKLSKVGGIPIAYHSGLFVSPTVAGKVTQIGPIHVTYYYETDPILRVAPQDGIIAGLIKTVNGRPYHYLSPFSTGGSGEQSMSGDPFRSPVTGNMDMEIEGIRVRILDRIPPAHIDAYMRREEAKYRAAEEARREAQVKKDAEIKAEAEVRAKAKAEEEARKKAN